MGTTTALRRALKAEYFAQLLVTGFEADQRHAPHFLDFRRIKPDRIEFISIQWEKSGRPRFKLMFGTTGRNGTISHGKHVQPSDVDPGSAPVYHCLYPLGDGSSTRHWFRQDRSLWQSILKRTRLRDTKEVISDVQRLSSQVDEYFRTGRVGPNCRKVINPWASNAA
jgi:hypothetical protein